MNMNELEAFLSESANVAVPVITTDQFAGTNRTLTLGYDVDRKTFHVYTHDGTLYLRQYDARKLLGEVSGAQLPAADLRPNKRVYPQYTEESFARVMRDLGLPLPFTNWSEPRNEGPYYGRTHVQGEISPQT